MLPKPWQSGQAPNGLLNENSRGCGTSYCRLHVAALEPLARTGAGRAGRRVGFDRERRAAAFGVGRLDRVGQAGAHVGVDLHAVDDHLQRRRDPSASPCRRRRGSPSGRRRSRRPKPLRRSAASVSATGSTRSGSTGCGAAALVVGRARRRLVVVALRLASAAIGAEATTGMSNPIEQARAFRQRAQPGGDDLGRLADHFLAAVAAERAADARVEQPQVVVDLGRRADRRARDCGCCSSAGWRSPGRSPRCCRRPASPSARGTAGRRPTATRRSGAALRRRWCRRRATTCPSR